MLKLSMTVSTSVVVITSIINREQIYNKRNPIKLSGVFSFYFVFFILEFMHIIICLVINKHE
jgi:hypothetical protein